MNIFTNNLKPSLGSKTPKKRLGRGIGSGWGKTAGRGHKGQHARKGGYHKIGFEGGQTPLQRTSRKFGFRSMKALKTQEIAITALEQLSDALIDYSAIKSAGLITHRIKHVKIIAAGNLTKALKLSKLRISAGARRMVEAVGGTIED